MKISIGIATAGRREVLSETLRHLAGQTRPADAVLVCPATPQDVDEDGVAGIGLPLRIIPGPIGSCAQRNAILDHAADTDVMIFLDDDFLPAPSFLAETERLFTAQPDLVVATGKVLADGIHGPGLAVAEGLAILARDDAADADGPATPAYNAYGCNMVVRMAAVSRGRIRFDENLPLYGWQEDVDFCRQLASHGSIISSPALRGVHLGSKRGRSSGLRFGYSQMANPLYLIRKGTVSRGWALRLMGRNLAANLAGSLRRPGLVDRRGRLRGNMLALWDVLRGRLSPRRILTL
ncbi:MAG TPA: glycosyltransferase [Roseomonas sp.]|jgi:GT2 family glycosyltransferase